MRFAKRFGTIPIARVVRDRRYDSCGIIRMGKNFGKVNGLEKIRESSNGECSVSRLLTAVISSEAGVDAGWPVGLCRKTVRIRVWPASEADSKSDETSGIRCGSYGFVTKSQHAAFGHRIGPTRISSSERSGNAGMESECQREESDSRIHLTAGAAMRQSFRKVRNYRPFERHRSYRSASRLAFP